MRINITGGSNTLYYILKDHLASASVVTDASGTTVGEQRYYPYGETRLASGTIYTDKLFTGQREMTGLGIYHYGARFYSPRIGRFISPDTIVPGYANPQNLNRFSYVRNNPIRYTDPTGHMFPCEPGDLCRPPDPRPQPPPPPPPPDPDPDPDPTPPDPIPTPIPMPPSPSPAPYLNTDYYQLIANAQDNCPSYASSCATVSYDQLDYYLNNTFETYQNALWIGAGISFIIAGAAFTACVPTALLGCGVGLLWTLIGAELTAEANESSSIGGYLHSELGNLNQGEATTISLDDADNDSRFFELNASNMSYGENIDLPINGVMLELSINYWNTGNILGFPIFSSP